MDKTSPISAGQYKALLERAITLLLASVPDQEAPPRVLYKLHYSRRSSSLPPSDASPASEPNPNILLFPSSATPSPVFNDDLLDNVQAVWSKIMQSKSRNDAPAEDDEDETSAFMTFDEREGFSYADDDPNDI